MIRNVELQDAAQIADIYNGYVKNTDISFETEQVGKAEMQERIRQIAARYPYIVYEKEGRIAGYCYAHEWKERAAYSKTLETTVYLHPAFKRQGIGNALMRALIEECRKSGFHALIACITDDNKGSIALHEQLGFRQVSHFKEVGYKFGRWLGVVDYELLL